MVTTRNSDDTEVSLRERTGHKKVKEHRRDMCSTENKKMKKNINSNSTYLFLAFPVLDQHLHRVATLEDQTAQLGETTVQRLQLFGDDLSAVLRLWLRATELLLDRRTVNANNRVVELPHAAVIALEYGDSKRSSGIEGQ